MKNELKKHYYDLFEKYGFELPVDDSGIIDIIRNSLTYFCKDRDNIAIYCYGEHTQMLLSDFVYELKNIQVIIDNYVDIPEESGYTFIRDNQIESYNIKSVIISSYRFKEPIIQSLKDNHPGVEYLDLYDCLEKSGIHLLSEYYHSTHPYNKYKQINSYQMKLKEDEKNIDIYKTIIEKYIQIKDFQSAIRYVEQVCDYWNEAPSLLKDLKKIYKEFLEQVSSINSKNVLLFCLDGFRAKDFEKKLPKLRETLKEKLYYFENAYSYSNSTFESLIPVYSEEYDIKGELAGKNEIPEGKTRFINLANEQKRNIYFYTDMEKFCQDKNIIHKGTCQTISEKLWDFVIDACRETNGLFYIHVTYETHFTFSNPYVDNPLISEGTAMLFDYLPLKGGKIRGDYVNQQECSVRYVDDVIAPFFEKLSVNVVFFADHGNILIDQNTSFEDVPESYFTFDDEWIRIPLGIISKKMKPYRDNRIISLTELNSIICSLLENKEYVYQGKDVVKVARTAIYNPDFKHLFKMKNCEEDLKAMEVYIYNNGKREVVHYE